MHTLQDQDEKRKRSRAVGTLTRTMLKAPSACSHEVPCSDVVEIAYGKRREVFVNTVCTSEGRRGRARTAPLSEASGRGDGLYSPRPHPGFDTLAQ